MQERSQDVKCYLNRGFELRKKIRIIENKIKVEEGNTGVGAIDYSREKVQSSPSSSPAFENSVIKVINLKKDLEELKKEYDKVLKEIEATADKLESVQEAEIIKLRHVDFYDWETIHCVVGVSRRTCFNIYKNAKKNLGGLI